MRHQPGYVVVFLLVFAFASVVSTSVGATEITDADRNSFRTIISGQIEAFRRDDGAAAFAYASP